MKSRLSSCLAFVLALTVFVTAALVSQGCMNVGGGRQVVPLPFSQPAIVMDGTAVNQKSGKASGAQMQPDGTPGNMPAGDQVVSAGTYITSQRSTDASLADEQAQASGRESPGSAVDNSTDKKLEKAGPTINAAPGSGASVQAGVPAGGEEPRITE